ncbi:MAG: FkbM family methyltransferase [Candidatus Neomarinimicrobiota bacterium]
MPRTVFGNIYGHPREGSTYAIFSALARNSYCICDVGAHIGVYTYLAACSSDPKKSSIFSFEPFGDLSAVIKRNVVLNDLQNVLVLDVAVGEKVGRADLYIPESEEYSSLEKEWVEEQRSRARFSVNVCSLDEYLGSDDLPVSDLVKIDVEQYESQVLKGMRKLILDHHPDIIIEFLGKSRRSGLIDKALADWDYNVYYITNEIQKMNADDGRYEHPFYNFLFTKRDVEDLDSIVPLNVSKQ